MITDMTSDITFALLLYYLPIAALVVEYKTNKSRQLTQVTGTGMPPIWVGQCWKSHNCINWQCSSAMTLLASSRQIRTFLCGKIDMESSERLGMGLWNYLSKVFIDALKLQFQWPTMDQKCNVPTMHCFQLSKYCLNTNLFLFWLYIWLTSCLD